MRVRDVGLIHDDGDVYHDYRGYHNYGAMMKNLLDYSHNHDHYDHAIDVHDTLIDDLMIDHNCVDHHDHVYYLCVDHDQLQYLQLMMVMLVPMMSVNQDH
jgi:hypothetical protein